MNSQSSYQQQRKQGAQQLQQDQYNIINFQFQRRFQFYDRFYQIHDHLDEFNLMYMVSNANLYEISFKNVFIYYNKQKELRYRYNILLMLQKLFTVLQDQQNSQNIQPALQNFVIYYSRLVQIDPIQFRFCAFRFPNFQIQEKIRYYFVEMCFRQYHRKLMLRPQQRYDVLIPLTVKASFLYNQKPEWGQKIKEIFKVCVNHEQIVNLFTAFLQQFSQQCIYIWEVQDIITKLRLVLIDCHYYNLNHFSTQSLICVNSILYYDNDDQVEIVCEIADYLARKLHHKVNLEQYQMTETRQRKLIILRDLFTFAEYGGE